MARLTLDKVDVEQSGAYQFKDAQPSIHHGYNLPAIEKLMPTGQHKILDAGCGNGYVANWLSQKGHTVWGSDYSESGVGLAQGNYPDLTFFQADLLAGPPKVVPPGGYDGIVTLEVIEHLFDPEKFLANLLAALKPGGFLILTTPYHGYVKNLALSVMNQWDGHFMVSSVGGHIKFFSPRTLHKMMNEQGFEPVKTIGAGRGPLLWCSSVSLARKPG